jgi:acyl-CoA reductase-like NAD-dependent aldehyde dehydrogenase
MADISMTIDGNRVSGPSTFEVINPATGAAYARAPACSGEQLDTAFESAARAFRGWKADEGARREALRKAAEVMFAAAAELGPILMAEQGKPLPEAELEAIGAGVWFKYYANDDGDLAELDIRLRRPNLLGDLQRLSGVVTGTSVQAGTGRVTCEVSSRNQRDEVTAIGTAVVLLKSRGPS